jgi:penicillin amidase
MKKSSKILLIIITVIALIFLVAILYIRSLKNSGLPDYNANIELEGLKEEVKVYRDQYGIPHIFAKNEADLYLVTGYITAQDRFWQMDFLRRVTQGRLSEILPGNWIETDVILRSLRITEKSKKIFEHADSEIKEAIESFSNGINQYLDDHKDDLSFEFTIFGYEPEKWEAVHSINLIGYMAWDLETGWGNESILYKLKHVLSKAQYEAIIPNLSDYDPVIYDEYYQINDSLFSSEISKINQLYPELFKGSNNWAVSSKKSTTGHPILANDMHLGLMVPGIWSQIHQHVEGKLDVSGLILPGQPFVICGHNENIAWGMTNVQSDGADFYIETINPENNLQYKFNGEWKDMIIKKELIHEKGNDSAVERTILFTHRGPVVSGFKDIEEKTISMRWVGNEMSNELRTVYLLNRAKNWNDFRNAVKSFKSISQNIVYADIDGNIGLQCSAGIPLRYGHGYEFLPGDTSLYDWKGLVEFDSLPFIYNPESAYVYSANNKTIGDDFPHYISNWFSNHYRAERIVQMLNEKEKLSHDDFIKMQTDHTSIISQEHLPTIIDILDTAENLNEEEAMALNILKDWDHTYSKESIASTIFEYFFQNLGPTIVRDEIPAEIFEEILHKRLFFNYLIDNIIKTGNSILCDDINTEEIENYEDMVIKTFKNSIIQFEDVYEKKITETEWGSVHKVYIEHPIGKNKLMDFVFNLNRVYSVGGSYHTVSPYSYTFNTDFSARHGASHRHIYDLGDFNKSLTIIPTGVSGIPGSDHYCDQTEMYVKGKYHEDYTDPELIKENAKYISIFTPKK